MDSATYLKIFLSASDLLIGENEDSICIGTMLPVDSPALDKVMQFHTTVIDALLEIPNLSQVEIIELLSRRGFTFHEFQTVLLDFTIPGKDFGKYNALRCLFLSSQKERREKLYHLSRDRHDYILFLEKILQPFSSELTKFLFNDESIS